MVRVARAWFRETNTAVAVTMGVTGGYVVYALLRTVAYGLIYPSLFENIITDSGDETVSLWFIDVYYPQILIETITFLLLAGALYVLFIWPGGEPTEEDPDTAECPECKSEIWADATRCAYCTSVVTPRSADNETESQAANPGTR